MATSLAKPPSHHRQTSQTNSISSSSVATVQRAASLSSRNGSLPAGSSLRSQSPSDSNIVPTNRSTQNISPDLNRRSSAIYIRPESGNGLREGIGNLNRWSQSTASSKSSATHNRKGSFSRRLSGSFGPFAGLTSSQSSPNPSVKGRPSTRDNAQNLTARSPQLQPPPKLPPLVALSSLSRAVDAAQTPPTAATNTPTTAEFLSTATSASGEPDYFGDKWKAALPAKQRGAGLQSIAISSFAARSSSPRYKAHSPGSESSRPSLNTDPAISLYSTRKGSRSNYSERYQIARPRHSRNRKGSTGTEGESSASSVRSTRAKTAKRKSPSQKVMLSKALQKANHAVLLDNAQNFEGAMDAYADACNLLQQVMSTSSTDEDRKKLEAVRNTYSHRISELRNNDAAYHSAEGKALPEPPRERDSHYQGTLSPLSPFADDFHENLVMSATTATGLDSNPLNTIAYRDMSTVPANDIPPRRLSLIPAMYKVEDKILHASEMSQSPLPPTFHVDDKILQASDMALQQQQRQFQARSNINLLDSKPEASTRLEPPFFQQYMPPPLSLQRPISPAPLAELSSSPSKSAASPQRSPPSTPPAELSASPRKQTTVSLTPNSDPTQPNHVRQDTVESTSWLDTIDESGGSSSESVHTQPSLMGLRRKLTRAPSGVTEAEFDAALDAAVEAAYDDGFEPDDDDDDQPICELRIQSSKQGLTSNERMNAETAKEMIHEAEREAAVLLAKDREKRRLEEMLITRDSIDTEYEEDEADEEERMLEEMTREYIMDDSEYDLQSKSALPRQSDSSGFSGRTWGSSIGSNPASAGTSLSTVAEALTLPSLATQLQVKPIPPPAHPPPSGALPPPPSALMSNTSSRVLNNSGSTTTNLIAKSVPGVRERRLSNMNAKQLKIETSTAGNPVPAPRRDSVLAETLPVTCTQISDGPSSAAVDADLSHVLANPGSASSSATPSAVGGKDSSIPNAPNSVDVAASLASVTSALTKATSVESEISTASIPNSPGRFAVKTLSLRKNFSSSSLKTKILAASSSDVADVSPALSTATQRKAPSTGLPMLPSSNYVVDRLPADDIFLFESEIHSAVSPGSPNPSVTSPLQPLEPCPEMPLLRPFWFLRCIYQTIAHPRGAYLSTKLFVPSSIWRVKGIKLKNVDEKISTCDLLSAALLKLAKVDTQDADAVLEEMQYFEIIMDQAQLNLSKRLGNEVGLVGASSLFKGPSIVDEMSFSSDTLTSKNTNTNSKSYLSSWRKLRSKSSAGPALITNLTMGHPRDITRESPTLESLPMTSTPDPKYPKGDLGRLQYSGPNSNYMAALARLCDAAQVLDQVGRQVEDPGLKHSSPTHVGLELSMRHAAEFFGFYICRFVVGDVSIMLDKFIKRGSEWVLA